MTRIVIQRMKTIERATLSLDISCNGAPNFVVPRWYLLHFVLL